MSWFRVLLLFIITQKRKEKRKYRQYSRHAFILKKFHLFNSIWFEWEIENWFNHLIDILMNGMINEFFCILWSKENDFFNYSYFSFVPRSNRAINSGLLMDIIDFKIQLLIEIKLLYRRIYEQWVGRSL